MLTKPLTLKTLYPWIICTTGLINLVVFNGLTTTALSVFDEELVRAFNLNRAEIKTKEGVTNLVAAVFIVVSGILIDRFRVKRLMLFGAVVMCIAFVFYSTISNKYEMYMAHFLLGLALITAGSIPTIILVSAWFKKRRGLALGITLIGTSLGGFIFPNLLTHLIGTEGWRQTFLYLAILPAVMFFVTLLVIRSSPEQIGGHPHGHDLSQPDVLPGNTLLSTGLTYQEAVRTRTFWLICICGMLTFYSVVGIISNLFLHMRGLGFGLKEASYALSLYFFMSLTGKFLISSLSDFVNVNRVFTACSLLMTFGVLGFTFMDKHTIYYAVGLTAISWGGIYTLYNVMIVKTFGLKAAGKINGTISFCESVGSFMGPVLTGIIFDQYQSYAIAFWVIGGIMMLSTLISLQFRTYSAQT